MVQERFDRRIFLFALAVAAVMFFSGAFDSSDPTGLVVEDSAFEEADEGNDITGNAAKRRRRSKSAANLAMLGGGKGFKIPTGKVGPRKKKVLKRCKVDKHCSEKQACRFGLTKRVCKKVKGKRKCTPASKRNFLKAGKNAKLACRSKLGRNYPCERSSQCRSKYACVKGRCKSAKGVGGGKLNIKVPKSVLLAQQAARQTNGACKKLDQRVVINKISHRCVDVNGKKLWKKRIGEKCAADNECRPDNKCDSGKCLGPAGFECYSDKECVQGLSCAIAEGAKTGKCAVPVQAPPAEEEEPVAVIACEDHDAHKGTLAQQALEKSKVTFGPKKTYDDKCDHRQGHEDKVQERICRNNMVSFDVYDCNQMGKTCKDGACVEKEQPVVGQAAENFEAPPPAEQQEPVEAAEPEPEPAPACSDTEEEAGNLAEYGKIYTAPAGVTTGMGGQGGPVVTLTDECSDANTLQEFYCTRSVDGNSYVTDEESHACGEGKVCEAGACVDAPEPEPFCRDEGRTVVNLTGSFLKHQCKFGMKSFLTCQGNNTNERLSNCEHGCNAETGLCNGVSPAGAVVGVQEGTGSTKTALLFALAIAAVGLYFHRTKD